MSSSVPSSGKSLSTPTTATHSSTPSQPTSSAGFESNRRQSQPTSQPQATPRKGQGLRKQHRNQRRAGSGLQDYDDDMDEIRAIRNASGRRGQTSITHLMNISLPPRPHNEFHNHASHSRSYRRNPAWGPGSGHHAMDKARYVHANYRFVVSPTGNYQMQAADADQHLEWSDVLQVIASTESQQASCPICLCEPVAPRMAKCGHIFCLSCIIRFMNTSSGDDGAVPEKKQNRYRKCPICEDTVFLSDVRPLRFYAGQESPLPRPGDDVVLRLMMRNANSTLALPKEGGADALSAGEDVPWHFAATVLDYARVMKGTGEYMEEQFDREIEDLYRQEKEDELLFHEGNEWTQKAIRAINAAKERVQGLGDAEVAVSSAVANSSQARRAEHDFYFYTSPPHLYLSPLDIRILKTKYGSFSAFPSTLLPRVEHISTGHVVDDAMRKRAKYLGHLPYGCLISFLECDWTDIVPAEILSTFADEIERRRKKNRDKAAEEERERLRAERDEAAAIRGARRGLGPVGEDVTVRFSAAPTETQVLNPNDFQPLGVAGATPPNPRQGFTQLQNISTSPSGPRTVWGTAAVPASPELAPTRPPVDDGWLKEDEFLESLSAAELAMHMEALAVENSAGPANAPSTNGVPPAANGNGNGNGGGGGKKKKQKKITLMSTGGRRGI